MTRKRFDGDPLEALRRSDPLDRLEVPTDTSEAHARALFQEITQMETMKTETPAPRRRMGMRIAFGMASAVAVAAAAIGGYALLADGAEPRIAGGEPIGSGAMQMCIQFDEATLVAQDMAFDGTLVGIDGSFVSFEVHRWYKGGEGDTVTLDAGYPVDDVFVALEGAPLDEGQRYLAVASDGFLWSCGYTVTYDSDLADHWAELFGA